VRLEHRLCGAQSSTCGSTCQAVGKAYLEPPQWSAPASGTAACYRLTCRSDRESRGWRGQGVTPAPLRDGIGSFVPVLIGVERGPAAGGARAAPTGRHPPIAPPSRISAAENFRVLGAPRCAARWSDGRRLWASRKGSSVKAGGLTGKGRRFGALAAIGRGKEGTGPRLITVAEAQESIHGGTAISIPCRRGWGRHAGVPRETDADRGLTDGITQGRMTCEVTNGAEACPDLSAGIDPRAS